MPPDVKLSAVNIRRAAKKLAEARAKARAAEEEYRARIRVALRQGMPADEVAEAAGVTRQRIYQIRDGKR